MYSISGGRYPGTVSHSQFRWPFVAFFDTFLDPLQVDLRNAYGRFSYEQACDTLWLL